MKIKLNCLLSLDVLNYIVNFQTTDVLDEASTPNSIKSIEHEIVVSPTRRRISDGIQSILSKLSMGSKQQDSINVNKIIYINQTRIFI